MRQLRAWKKSCGAQKKRGTGKIAGNSRFNAAQPLPAANAHFVSLAFKLVRQRPGGHFPVIARPQRFFDARFAVGQQARK